eukprot:1165567-Pyramimonas_sp.AAC.1
MRILYSARAKGSLGSCKAERLCFGWMQEQNQMCSAPNKPRGTVPPALPRSPPAPYLPCSQPAAIQAPLPPPVWCAAATGEKRPLGTPCEQLQLSNRPCGGLPISGATAAAHHPSHNSTQSTSAGRVGNTCAGNGVEGCTSSSDVSRPGSIGTSAGPHREG